MKKLNFHSPLIMVFLTIILALGCGKEIKEPVDTTAPVVTLSSPTGDTVTNNNKLKVTGSIDDSAISSVTFILNGWQKSVPVNDGGFSKTITLIEGSNSFQVTAVDQAGKRGDSPKLTIILDTVSPSVAINLPESGTYINTNTVIIKGTIADSAPSSEIEGGILLAGGVTATISSENWTVTLTGLDEGSITITARVWDRAGNEGESLPVNITIDTQAPQVSITSPAPGSTNALIVIVEGTASDALSGIALVTVNDVTADFFNGNFSYILNGLSGGPLTVIAEATDNAGNTASDAVSIIISPPVITSLNPTRGAVGTEVIINGGYFGTVQGSSTVSFSGVEAPITVWSEEVIVARVPEGATPGPVVVKVNGAKSNGVYFLVLDIWFPIGPGGGRIRSLAIDPVNPNIIYAGTDKAGVFKSVNGGELWFAVNKGLPVTLEGGMRILGPMAIDPVTPSTIYVPIWEAGIYKSLDGGLNWFDSSNGLSSLKVGFVAVDPLDPDILYTTGGKSYDGGANWISITTGYNIIFHPLDSDIIYRYYTGSGIYQSINGGLSWVEKNNGLTSLDIRALVMDQTAPDILYAGSFGAGVFKTFDGGDNWTQAGLPSNNVYSLAIDPANPSRIYAGTTVGMFTSTDGGSNWNPSSSGMGEKGVRCIAINSNDPNIIYAGTEYYGVFKSINGGANWQAINTGLFNFYARYIAIDPISTSIIYTGGFKSTDGGANWCEIPSRFSTTMVIDPQTTSILYAGGSGGIFKSIDAGATWFTINNGLTDTRILELIIDPTNTSILYTTTFANGLFKTTDGGDNWFPINNGLPSDDVVSQCLAISPENTNIIFAGIDSVFDIDTGIWTPGRVYKSIDGGNNWFLVLTIEGIRDPVSSLAIHPLETDIIFAGGDRVYKSTDGGASWNHYIDGLPYHLISSIVPGPSDTSLVYLSMGYFSSLLPEGDVFRSIDGGVNWQAFNEGLLNIQILDLKMDPQNPKVLYTASNGGGIYKRILQ
jgi:photosystem II stability/assembly factor-like uncharacterized protein